MRRTTILGYSLVVWAFAVSLGATPRALQTNYRSIGVKEGPLYAVGTASVDAGEALVSFRGATIPNPYATGAVGVGDKLVIGGETLYVLSRVSPTQVVLQGKARENHLDQPFVIERAYRSLREWESDREGNLVEDGRREVGVLYNDGPFVEGLVVQGSKTDAEHFLQITVAEGQRHDGVGSIGAFVEPEDDGDVFDIRDDYTRLEWLEIRGWKGRGAAAIRVAASGTYLSNLIVHDGESEGADGVVYASAGPRGPAVLEGSLSSSIIYRASSAGVRVQSDSGVSLLVRVTNLSVYGCGLRQTGSDGDGRGGGGGGIVLTGGAASASAANVVAIENHPSDFVASTVASGSWSDSSHNISSDASAPGPASMTGVPSSEVFLAPSPDTDNYHLRPDSPARHSGANLLLTGDVDIDGDARPATAWDRGADEVSDGVDNTLMYFGARQVESSVVVQWVTRNESPGVRFRIRRGRSSDGPWQVVTRRDVAGLAASVGSTSYFVRDDGAATGSYYLLEISGPDGVKGSYGPVSLGAFSGADAFSMDAAELGLDSDGKTAVAYGVPGATSWRVLQRDEHHVDLELTIGGFTAASDGSDPFVLHLEKGEDQLSVGPFSLPLFRAWLGGLRTADVALELVRSQNMVTFSPRTEGGRKAGETSPNLPVARILKVVSRGAESDALVELAPLRWDGASERLTLARRIVVRLTLGRGTGRESESESNLSVSHTPENNRR